METYVCTKSLQLHLTLCDPIDCSPRILCPWNSPDQNTGVGSHSFFHRMDLLDPGIKPRSPTLQTDSLPSEPPGKPPKIELPLNMFDSNIEYLHKISQHLPKMSCLHPFLSNHHVLSGVIFLH